MKVVIAGGRNYRFTAGDVRWLDSMADEITEVVSGRCRGADESGEEWAKAMGIPVKQFPADWKRHGRSAGPIRNREMAEYADAVILFPGGRGTESMRQNATRLGKRILERKPD